MGSALDEAERALVTGSWSKASDAAATARRVARTAPDRVAAECVWVQAEYKLGRLGETHEGDARRVTGVGGDPLEPQTLLLWSRLTLADAPRARPETNEDDPKARRAEASAADALAGVFREAFRRRQRCATESRQPSDLTNWLSSLTIFIPLPPPPPAALIKTGYPMFLQIDFASFTDFTPPSEPSITGRPYFFAIFLASILSPIFDIISALGPINFIPCFFTISENFAFSDKKPYPGCIASAPVRSTADMIDEILR